MSSFTNPHYFYLFSHKNNDKLTLTYGESPEDAYDALRLRLTEDELSNIIFDKNCLKIRQNQIRDYIAKLG